MAKAVTLKNTSNEEVYPVTDISLVNGELPTARIADSAVTTDKIADESVTSDKIDWTTALADPDVDDGLGWTYLGQTRLTSPASSLTFIFPQKYDNYRIIFGGELSSGSNVSNELQFRNGNTTLTLNYQAHDITNGTVYTGYSNNAVTYVLNGNSSAYDTVNAQVWSVKTASSQWRKFQGTIDIVGSVFRSRRHSGRLTSATEPDRVVWTSGGTYGTGAVLKVWGSNNT